LSPNNSQESSKQIIKNTKEETILDQNIEKGYIFQKEENEDDSSSIYFVCPNLYPMLPPNTQSNSKKQKISFLIPLNNETFKQFGDENSNTIKYTKLSIYENQIERSEAFIVLDNI